MLTKHDICGSVYSSRSSLLILADMLARIGTEYQISANAEYGAQLDYAFPAQGARDPRFVVDEWRQRQRQRRA